MHRSTSAAVPCSDAKPNSTSLSSYPSSRKTPSPITVTTSLCTSTPPQRRPRSFRLRRHHPTRRKDHPSRRRKLADPSTTHHEDPKTPIEASNTGHDTSDVGVRAGLSSADREHPTRESRRPRVSGTPSTPRRASSSDRHRLVRLVPIGQKSQEADIQKAATNILS